MDGNGDDDQGKGKDTVSLKELLEGLKDSMVMLGEIMQTMKTILSFLEQVSITIEGFERNLNIVMNLMKNIVESLKKIKNILGRMLSATWRALSENHTDLILLVSSFLCFTALHSFIFLHEKVRIERAYTYHSVSYLLHL